MNLFGMDFVKSLEQQGNDVIATGNCSEVSGITARKLFEFVYLYESLVGDLNRIKAKLDETYKAKQVEDFKKALREFKYVAHKMWDAKAALKSRRKMKHLKIHADLLGSALNKIAYIENTIAGAEKWVKDSSKSPAQLAAAKKASLRMRMAWGM